MLSVHYCLELQRVGSMEHNSQVLTAGMLTGADMDTKSQKLASMHLSEFL